MRRDSDAAWPTGGKSVSSSAAYCETSGRLLQAVTSAVTSRYIRCYKRLHPLLPARRAAGVGDKPLHGTTCCYVLLPGCYMLFRTNSYVLLRAATCCYVLLRAVTCEKSEMSAPWWKAVSESADACSRHSTFLPGFMYSSGVSWFLLELMKAMSTAMTIPMLSMRQKSLPSSPRTPR